MKILVFQQTGLPVSEGCGGCFKKLSQKAELQFVDTKGIMSGQFSGDYSLQRSRRILSYGNRRLFFSFFAQGGGLLHRRNALEKAMVCENGAWREVIRTLGDLRITRDMAACRCQWIFSRLDLVLLHIPRL